MALAPIVPPPIDPISPSKKVPKKVYPWYLGGCASMSAVCFTHPLDTIKVQLQTQQQARFGFVGMGVNIVKTSGFGSLYNGLSAALLRQATYSGTRFYSYGNYSIKKNDLFLN
jgi:solute carrier family 25 (mitochondrial dicarboxylate transporter), member 10